MLAAEARDRLTVIFFFQAEDGIRACLLSRGLGDVYRRQVRGFSSGMQRRLAIGRVLLARPRLLLLDEPYSNLDRSGIDLMNAVIEESVHTGAAAMVVVHELALVANMLDRTVAIVGGRIDSASSDEADADATIPRMAISR